MFDRRRFLAALLAAQAAEKLPPVRAITRGPKFHWFGYYDKLQFDPTSRYALGVEGDFEHRLPTARDTLRIGMVDTEDRDRWIDLGETRAWSWHQTCMLQWLPGSKSEIIWNDREGGRFVSHILDVRSGKKRTLPHPIYCLSRDARWALSTDFRRLYDARPETGYAGVPDPNRDVLAPDSAGVWRVDLHTSKQELLISYADTVRVPWTRGDWTGAKHWFNHLLYCPDGSRFVFFQRWRGRTEGRRFTTRMFSASAAGKDLRVLDDHGGGSHFNWRDARTLLAWARRPERGDRFYLFEDRAGGRVEPFEPDLLTRNGHCSFLPGNRWLLSDTGPDEKRLQHPYLFDTQSRRLHPLGHFYAAPEYTGYWRCDTTPRFSPDGCKVVLDSPHGGNGRQMYLIDVSGIVS
jgi:hypothetical protein